MLLIFQAIRMCTRTSLNEELSRTPAEETSIHSLGKVKEVPNLDHDTLQLLCNAAGLPPESPSLRTMVTSVQIKIQWGGCFSTQTLLIIPNAPLSLIW